MNKAVIFLNGESSDPLAIKKHLGKDTLLIGCDGGTEKILELKLWPDVVVGDFDSFNKKMLKGVNALVLPTDKDYTDSEAAILYALKKGVTSIILTGALGGRTDHLLGNVFLLAKKEFAGADIKIIDDGQEIYSISGQSTITGKVGQTISFLPLFGDVRAQSCNGLKYDLSKYNLSMNGNNGISNEFIKDTVHIMLEGAPLLVTRHKNTA